jgi:hypothetical protein
MATYRATHTTCCACSLTMAARRESASNGGAVGSTTSKVCNRRDKHAPLWPRASHNTHHLLRMQSDDGGAPTRSASIGGAVGSTRATCATAATNTRHSGHVSRTAPTTCCACSLTMAARRESASNGGAVGSTRATCATAATNTRHSGHVRRTAHTTCCACSLTMVARRQGRRASVQLARQRATYATARDKHAPLRPRESHNTHPAESKQKSKQTTTKPTGVRLSYARRRCFLPTDLGRGQNAIPKEGRLNQFKPNKHTPQQPTNSL